MSNVATQSSIFARMLGVNQEIRIHKGGLGYGLRSVPNADTFLQHGNGNNDYEPSVLMAIPSTSPGDVLTRSVAGCLKLPADPGGGHLFRLAGVRHLSSGAIAHPPGLFMVVDRLVGMSGLVGNVTTLQSVAMQALPSRAPSGGEDVFPAIEMHATPGAGISGGTQVTLTYTNSDGVTGRTAQQPASNNWQTTSSHETLVGFQLQAGDKGVQTVTGFQLSTAGPSAGNLGIVLYRPVLLIPYQVQGSSPAVSPTGRFGHIRANRIMDWLRTGLAPVDPQACLDVWFLGPSSQSNSGASLQISFDTVYD